MALSLAQLSQGRSCSQEKSILEASRLTISLKGQKSQIQARLNYTTEGLSVKSFKKWRLHQEFIFNSSVSLASLTQLRIKISREIGELYAKMLYCMKQGQIRTD